MREIVITKTGGPSVLKIQEREDPIPQADEVRIRVKASGVNFADILARQGLYPDAPKIPCVVGYEVSGVIDALGENVPEEMQGQKVMALTRFHGYSDAVVVPVGQVIAKPEKISFEEAASIPVVYITAYQLMIVMGSLQEGEGVLIHNAGGGVGLAALDIALKIGAVSYGTASAHKHDFLKKRGIDHVIDYRNKDWSKELNKLTEGKGVELILDPLGGKHWKKSYRALRSTGRLGMFGISSASESRLFGKLKLLKVGLQMPIYSPLSLLDKNRSVYGVNLGHMWHETKKVTGWLEKIVAGVEEGWVRPHVDKVYPFSEVGKAHTYMEERKNIGKVILTP